MRSLMLSLFVLFTASGAIAQTRAAGLGVNMPLVGRLVGGGGTLYVTALDVSNHATASRRVDFYLDGREATTGEPLIVRGSISATGTLVPQGTGGSMRARSNAHFEDFIDDLVDAGLLPITAISNGFLGSVLFVFDGSTKSGTGSVTARFFNSFGGGTVGVSLKGRELTNNEPKSLVASVLDTRANESGLAKTYPNLFINNVGMTPNGVGLAGPVTVEVSAIASDTGQAIGVPIRVSDLPPGRTVVVGQVLNALQIPLQTANVLVFARVISGNAAIQGVVSQVYDTTNDSAVFEMSRADF